MTDLDTLINQTASFQGSCLEGVEDGVWDRVGQARAKTRDRTFRFAALGVAAFVGGVAGVVYEPQTTVDRGELSVFSPRMAATPLDLGRALG